MSAAAAEEQREPSVAGSADAQHPGTDSKRPAAAGASSAESTTQDASTPSTSLDESQEVGDTSAASEDPELRRLKTIHAARISARRRPSSASSASLSADNLRASLMHSSDREGQPSDAASVAELEETIRQLRSSHEVELQSLRRNHIQNLKKVAAERDMFAAQLAKEQASPSAPATERKQLSDLHAQLRAARIRTADLQEEVTRLKDENKQLLFRVQANKALNAAADSYANVVDDLVSAKVKCAQLEEEKEEYRRASKESASSIALLAEANGDLEKSRADWVIQCADLQRQVDELQKELANFKHDSLLREPASAPPMTHRRAKSDVSTTSPNSSLSGVPLD
jgi:hypothetical protein